LLVASGAGPQQSIATPAGRIHAIEIDAGEDPLVLRYGLSDRRYEIAIEPAAETRRAGFDFPAVDSLFLVGDVHGAYDNLTRLLANAGLVDAELRWRGGRAHLAFVGDLVDRGPEATRVLWLVYRLEREAARAGGRVHVVLGNHEIMAIAGDHRYLHPKEARHADCYGVPYQRLLDPESSVLGRWLATKPGVLRIGDVLLAHGGVAPRWVEGGLEAFDDSLAAFLQEDLMIHWYDATESPVNLPRGAFDRRYAMFWDQESVFWFRGYVVSDTLDDALARVLSGFTARVHAVGHTPIERIEARYGGRLLALNTREFATELVLLDRTGPAPALWRHRDEGSPERLD
jgi:hypothetical protein